MIPIANPTLSEEAKANVHQVLDSGMLADGPEVRSFESEFADYCGVDHGVATSNGTTALHAALKALGIGDGDTVVTSPFSFIATANAIELVGATPVFADVLPETYNLDPGSVASVAGSVGGIDAILTVHLYGLPSRLDELQEIADDHDAYLIEDAAQAHGARYRGDRVGSIGDVACFSFYPTKNMTTGEGGMVVTDDVELAERADQFINHGRGDGGGYDHEIVGHNFRMTSIAAAIGRSQLERLPDLLYARRRNADQLTAGLESTVIEPPVAPAHCDHAYHQYTVRTSHREAFCSHLEEHDIGYGVYYPTCIHDQPAYSDVDHSAPVAEQAAREVVSLPVHPALTDSEVKTIIEVVSDYE